MCRGGGKGVPSLGFATWEILFRSTYRTAIRGERSKTVHEESPLKKNIAREDIFTHYSFSVHSVRSVKRQTPSPSQNVNYSTLLKITLAIEITSPAYDFVKESFNDWGDTMITSPGVT